MENDKNDIRQKDTTKYGEFVCSAFRWLPIEKQKEKAEEISNMTNQSDSKQE